MNAGPFAPLLEAFNRNWLEHRPDLEISVVDADVELTEGHPLHPEIAALCGGTAASLPFFGNEVIWCTMGPDADALRIAVADLQAWVLPSFGGEGAGDG